MNSQAVGGCYTLLILVVFLEDELENVALAEHERNEKNKELKIKRRDYTGYDDEEFAPGQAGMKRSLLSKYDEFLEGPKETVCSYHYPRIMIDHSQYLSFRDSVWVARLLSLWLLEWKRKKPQSP